MICSFHFGHILFPLISAPDTYLVSKVYSVALTGGQLLKVERTSKSVELFKCDFEKL